MRWPFADGGMRQNESASAPAIAGPIVRLSEVYLRYGDVEALAGVSLSVGAGSLTALVGRNGAGKTTMINALCGLLVADSGRIELFGRDRNGASQDGHALLRLTGFLLSDPALFQYLTVAETLAFLADAYGLRNDEARRRVDDLVRFFDLEEVRDRMSDELSTGTAKRLAIAAALVHAPRLLVLDEPFESLDPLLVRRLRRLLVRYVRRGGSVLLSSHLVDVVQEISDYVYILDKGRIVFEGPCSEFRDRARPSDEGGALESMYASLVDNSGDLEVEWL